MSNGMLATLLFVLPLGVMLFVGKRWFGRASGGLFSASSRDSWNDSNGSSSSGDGGGGDSGGGDGGGGD